MHEQQNSIINNRTVSTTTDQQQQNSINIHLVTILAGSLEWPEGDLAKDGVSQGGSQAPQVGRWRKLST